MKRKGTLALLLLAALVVLAAELWLERTYPDYEMVAVSEDSEAILKTEPSLFITEEDLSFMEALRQCPTVRESFAEVADGFADLSIGEYPDVNEIVDRGFEGRDMVFQELHLTGFTDGESLYFQWLEGRGREYALTYSIVDGEAVCVESIHQANWLGEPWKDFTNEDNRECWAFRWERNWFNWFQKRVWEL